MAIRIDKVFYELTLEVKDFEKGLADSEKAAGKFADFVLAHPTAAAGAFAAALTGIAIAATDMAMKLDASLRQAANSMPALQGQLESVKDELIAISNQTPHSAQELADLYAQIAKSTDNPAEAMARLRAVIDGVDAAGGDAGATVKGLTVVLDAFGVSSGHAGEVMAKLFAATQGKVPLDEMFETIEKGATSAHALGLSLDETIGDVAALTHAGVPARQSMSDLVDIVAHLGSVSESEQRAARQLGLDLSATGVASKGVAGTLKDLADKTHMQVDILEQLGFTAKQVQAIQVLGNATNEDAARTTLDAADAQRKLQDAASFTRTGAEALDKELKNQLSNTLLDLGNKLLPELNEGLAAAVGFMALLDGEINRISLDSTTKAVTTMSQNIRELTGQQQIDGVKELTRQFLLLEQSLNLSVQMPLSADQIKKLTNDQLVALQAGTAALYANGVFDPLADPTIHQNLSLLNQAAGTRRIGAPATAGAKTTTGSGGARAAKPLTDDQLAMIQEAKDALAKATDDLGAELHARVSDIIEKVKKQFGSVDGAPDVIKQWIAAATAQANDAAALSDADKMWKAIQDQAKASEGGNGAMPSITDLDDVIAKTEQANATSVDGQIKKNALLDQERDLRKKIFEAQQQTIDAANQFVAAEKASGIPALQEALDEFVREMPKKFAASGDDPAVAAAMQRQVQAMQAGIDTAVSLEPLQQKAQAFSDQIKIALDEFAKGNAGPLNDLKTSVSDATAEAENLESVTNKTGKDYQTVVSLVAELKKLGIDIANGQITADEKRLRALKDQATLVRDTAKSALDLGTAFGLFGKQTADALGNVVSIAASIQEGLGALKEVQAGTPGAGAALGNSLLAIGSGISALFAIGQQQAQQAALLRAALEKDTKAVDSLTKKITTGLSLTVSGTDVGGLEKALGAALNVATNGNGRDIGQNTIDTLKSQLAALGLTMDDLKTAASEVGVTFAGATPTVQEMDKAMKALKAADLTAFTHTFAGQLDMLAAKFKIFDITDPIKQLQSLIDLSTSSGLGSPFLKRLFGGIDPTTPEGQAALRKALETAFTDTQNGLVSGDDLGNMTGQQLIDTLTQIAGLLPSSTSATASATGTSQSLTVDTQLTQATGSQIAAMISSGNAWLAQIAASAAAMQAQLTKLATPGYNVLPPPTSVLNSIPQGGQSFSFHVDQIVINVGATEDADAIAKKVMDALEQEFYARAGSKLRARRRSRGDATVQG